MRLPVRFRRKLNAPRSAVFHLITDYDNLQENFPGIFVSARVLERSKNGAVTEERFSVLGTVIEQRSRHAVRAPKTHQVEILTGDLHGSKMVESYSEAPDGMTIVEVKADFVLGGFPLLDSPVHSKAADRREPWPDIRGAGGAGGRA